MKKAGQDVRLSFSHDLQLLGRDNPFDDRVAGLVQHDEDLSWADIYRDTNREYNENRSDLGKSRPVVFAATLQPLLGFLMDTLTHLHQV
ncbi:MAG: hypothetical protein JWN18_733 [Parcubacteria group bacterium]|nr:hypothetical protein [Parcubacteria group bacterium]